MTLHDLQLSEGPPESGFNFMDLVTIVGEDVIIALPDGNVSLAPAFEPGVIAYSASVSQADPDDHGACSHGDAYERDRHGGRWRCVDNRQPKRCRQHERSGRVHKRDVVRSDTRREYDPDVHLRAKPTPWS